MLIRISWKLFLDEIFLLWILRSPSRRESVWKNLESFQDFLRFFNRFPLAELIVHPRLRKDFYKGKPDLEAFALAVRESKNPLCYNGDLFSKEMVRQFTEQFPSVDRLMLGRGLVANPALLSELYGEPGLSKESFLHFHDRLVEEYRGVMSGDKDVLFKMKELWFYMSHLFTSPETYMKKIKKAGSLAVYEEIVHALLREQEIAPKTFYTF